MTAPLDKRVLLVGAGGLGCPAGVILARAGVSRIDIADDDEVDESNLHRQLLYGRADVGQPKAVLACARLEEEAAAAGHRITAVAREMRARPDNAKALVADYDLVLEGADNFASKFLLADACALASVPLVQGGAVRWLGWALATLPGRSACLRCVFEHVPSGPQHTCAEAGVVGPVVGVIAALQAALSLRLLSDQPTQATAAGQLYSYDALAGTLRARPIARQAHCALCNGAINDLDLQHYLPPECAA